MGNSLLDFVMTLVRDPEAAARYATDPAGALADAQLSGVTFADVNNLIPVVTDSLAAATPGFGASADQGNVWTSGAAAAAFDAFDIPVPPAVDPAAVQPPAVIGSPVVTGLDQASEGFPTLVPPAPAFGETLIHQPLSAVIADPIDPDWVDDAAAAHPHIDPVIEHHPPDHPGFDLL